MAERRAYVCKKRTDPKVKCNLRIFATPADPPDFVPSCPDHGKMQRDPNRPYNVKRGERSERSTDQR